MTDTIDKRIVEMAFQNDAFEKNVGTSLGTLDKLKKSLNFDNAAKSFSGITAASQKVNFNTMAEGISNISSKFSALGILAITTMVNIANSAYQAGVRVAKALTIDPIKAGLTEYETKLNSIQTILANTQKEGTDIKIVTRALDELNEYSDKTIYNFQQMTRNVGTFTAAGVKLDTSVAAIKGIANLAAISGSNADQASTAMYQLSQALSSGSVKLMDWNSVVNAGMGGQVFQESIKETARLHGVAIDQMIEEEGSFRETLQKGWFTSEILTETLAKFTGDLNAEQLKTMGYTEEQIKSILKMGQTANDAATKVKTFSQLFNTLKEAAQSGWAKTWEIILGDFEEAKVFFTEANNILGGMLGASAEARNAILQGWKDLGGRKALITAVRNAFEGILSVIKPITDALKEIFPPVTAQQLYTLTLNLTRLSEKFKMGGEGAEKLKRIFKGVFAVVDIFAMAISALGRAIFRFSDNLGPPLDIFTDFLVKIADYIVAIRDGLKSTHAFNTIIENIGKALEPIISIVKKFFESFSGGMDVFKGIELDGLTTFMDKLKIRFEPLRQLAILTGKFLGLIGALLGKLAPIAVKLGGVVADSIGSFIDRITLALENYEPERVFDIINGGLLAGVLLAIKKFVDKGSGMFSGVKDVLNSVKGSLEAWQASLKADVLLKIAGALGIMALSIIALSMIDSKKLTVALGAMTTMFVQLGVSLLAFQKVSSSVNPVQMGVMAVGLLSIATAMFIMSSAVSKLGKMDSKQLVKGMLAITAIIGVMKISASTLSNSSSQMITGAAALIVFSFAIRSLSKAVFKLGAMDTESLTKGLIGVGVLVTELALFMRLTDLSGMGVIKSVGILILAGAVNLLAIAVGKLAAIDTDSITKGLVAMGLIFTELAAFITLTGGAPGLILTATGVGVISVAMLVLAEVMEKLGNLSWEEIAKGLVAMAGALVLIGAAAYLIPPTLIIQAAGLIVMAGALVILSKALTTMGEMSWDEIARGLVVLAGSMLILSVGLSAMSGTFVGSAALLLASVALLALAPALKVLGSMSMEEIGRGLLALAGVFLVLGVAGAVLTPVIPTLIGLGVAMLLVGVAMTAAGVGMLAFSAGLAALSVSGAAGAGALAIVVSSIVGLVPMLVKTLGRAILALIDVLVAGAPTLLEGVITLLNILLDGLLSVMPKIVEVVITLVETLLTKLAEKYPVIVQAGYDIILAFLEGVANNIEDIVIIVTNIMNTFINAISEQIPSIVDSGWRLIISWIDGMKQGVEDHLPELLNSVRDLGFAIVKGVLQGLIEGHGDAREGIKELGRILVEAFKSFLGINSPSTVFMTIARDIILGLVKGIKDNISSAVKAITDLGKKIVDAIKGKYKDMVSAGRELVRGFIAGIREYIILAVGAAKELVGDVLEAIANALDSHSPSRKMIEQGKYVDQGLAGGISKFSNVAVNSVKQLGQDVLSNFNSIISSVADSLNTNINLNPTIRPVVDLSAVEKGGSEIDNILGGKKLNLMSSMNRISGLASKMKAGTNDVNIPSGTTSSTSNVSFTQNNYSPKALSRLDIYRQTRNQLALVEGFIGEK